MPHQTIINLNCLQLTICSVSIAAIGRTVQLIPLLEPRSTKFVDVTWLVVSELNWAFAEGSVAIVAASLPSIRPLFQRLLSKKECEEHGNDNDRSVVALDDLSHGSRGNRANKQWPHSNKSSLHGGPPDEELGLCPGLGRSNQGSGMISTLSESTIHESRATGGRSRGTAEPCRWVEVSIADFAVTH